VKGSVSAIGGRGSRPSAKAWAISSPESADRLAGSRRSGGKASSALIIDLIDRVDFIIDAKPWNLSAIDHLAEGSRPPGPREALSGGNAVTVPSPRFVSMRRAAI
jgi:hypothetical protein